MYNVFQYQLRLKTIAYEFLHGKKSNLQLGEKWIGDELGNRKLNPRAQEFINSVSMHDTITCTWTPSLSPHMTLYIPPDDSLSRG